MSEYGAKVERGYVVNVSDDGYMVKSYTRDGITTPPIRAMGDAVYRVDDKVYYFVFDDGQGMVLGKIG